jgi:hypothetical protein
MKTRKKVALDRVGWVFGVMVAIPPRITIYVKKPKDGCRMEEEWISVVKEA